VQGEEDDGMTSPTKEEKKRRQLQEVRCKDGCKKSAVKTAVEEDCA
jgi:hypothetical protein